MTTLLLATTPVQPRRASGGGAPKRDTTWRDTTQQDTMRRDTTRDQDASGGTRLSPAGEASGVRLVGRAGTRRDSAARDAARDTLTPRADTLAQADTAGADTSAVDTLRLVPRYAPSERRRGQRGSVLFPEPASARTAGLSPPEESFWHHRPSSRYEHALALDSTDASITATERVGKERLAPAARASRTTYRGARRRRDARTNWLELRRERARQRRRERRGLGVSINVPGGRESAFTTIFGKNEVSLDINGQANVNAGLKYRRSDQQAQVSGSPTQIDPAFKQDLRLGITGAIGDKMRVDVNWDTQSQFDYQNQVKLRYTGYEDEIVQRVEAGNVFLETPTKLINGGQSLFGIKSQFRLGGLQLTTIASQQEGQSNSLSIEGGSETNTFDFTALQYDNLRHFFLGYYFRNNWNRAHDNPQGVTTGFGGFDRITDIEVWKLKNTRNTDDESLREAAALVDLGEPARLVAQAEGYTNGDILPSPDRHQYSDSFLDQLRDPNEDANMLLRGASLDESLEENKDFFASDGETFKLLEGGGRDYSFDNQLGFLSLNQRLRDSETLAVAFRYETVGGQPVQVGDFSAGNSDRRLVLKLLRPGDLPAPGYDVTASEPQNGPAAWYLQMRNIYELRGRGFNPDGFTLGVEYNPPGSAARTTLEGLGGQQTILELLGLDRLDEDGTARPDGRFDFNGATINRQEGLLYFPYLQPFGARLRQVVDEQASAEQQEVLRGDYVLEQLYYEKQNTLENTSSQMDNYQVVGESKGGTQSFYDLKAFNGLVENSVEVTADGSPLTEGTDYQVDYQGGTVTILNERYLSTGSNIEIDYEKNALINLQKKTLLGARADYRIRDNFGVGATLMRLSQRSPADKLRINQEPIKNTIWGVDAGYESEPRWLTRAVDALPLVQTRAPSALSINAEFAQLRPGHTETQAFERTRRRLQEEDRDFFDDELEGVSYIDDFEGFENSFSLQSQLQGWKLAAAPADYDAPATPDSAGAGFGEARAANDWRGLMGWYQINRDIIDRLEDAPAYDDALRERVQIRDVFPSRDTRAEVDNTLRTLDLYFDPQRRGAYNYNGDLRDFLERPERAWGGFTQRLPEGQTDFGVKNIEFVEFIFRPYPSGAGTSNNATLYLNLGSVSEDIIPNGSGNDEDGLSLTTFDNFYNEGRSREPTGKPNNAVDLQDGVTEDLGLDGLASYVTGGDVNLYDGITEQTTFEDFVSALPAGGSGRLGAIAERARRDPSGDDYHSYDDEDFFDDEALFPGGASFQERLSFYYAGLELNSHQAQNTLSSEYVSGRGIAREPDAENFAFDELTQQGEYFVYEIPMGRQALDRQSAPGTTDDFIVGEIKRENGSGTGWYQARVPVRAATDTVGNPDLNFVEHMRLWTTGHAAPTTLRFASLELVGSQWRKSENVTLSDTTTATPDPDEDAGTRLTIASINNEEDSGTYQRPRRAVVAEQQVATGGRQRTREQSLVVRVEGLRRGNRRAIFKRVQNLNLLRYGGLRMFTHLHSTGNDFVGLGEEAARASGVELFVRFGANETGDYYEYRQPLTPTLNSLTAAPVEQLWYPLDAAERSLANEMNIRLAALNQLKAARDQQNADANEVYWSREGGEAGGDIRVPLEPALESFAPPGARIGIKGTPSLQNVNTIVVGLRATEDADQSVYDDLTLWINELRATGYDERNGWSARADVRARLADFIELDANFQRQTDGFGGLASTLGERQQDRRLNWSAGASFALHKLLPSTAGWRFPVSVDVSSNTLTPRYAPNRGDVRLDALLSQVDEGGLSATRAEVLRTAQTRSTDRRFTMRLSKEGSASPWLRYTLDNLSLDYGLSRSSAANPQRQREDRWRWNADLDYQYDFERPRTVRPLWFLEELPLAGDALGGLRFNYAPQSVTFSSTVNRNATEQQDRPARLFRADDSPEIVREPIRDTHTFDHNRSFNLSYRPLDFVNLRVGTQTNQSLNRVGAQEAFRVVEAGGATRTFDTRSAAEAYADDNLELNEEGGYANGLIEDRLRMFDTGGTFERLFSGAAGPRTKRYAQSAEAQFQLPFGESEALNWVEFEDVSYLVRYNWVNSARGSNLGANVSNNVSVNTGLALQPVKLWRKFGFYRTLEEQQEEAMRQAKEDRRDDEEETDLPAPEEGEEEGEGETDRGPVAGSERSFSDLTLPDLPNPLGLLRRVFLGLTGVEDFSITYEASRRSDLSNIGLSEDDTTFASGSHTLLGAFQGNGPPLGYRLGLDRRLGAGLRPQTSAEGGSRYTLEDRLADGNKLQARTSLEFSENLRVDLNWLMDWEDQTTYSNLGAAQGETRTIGGSNSASIWGFGGGYQSFFERQLETLRGDLQAPRGRSDTVNVGIDGRAATSNATITEDFREAFTTSLGATGQHGFLMLPLPSWRVTYSGLSDWPLVRSLTQSVRLEHGYASDYTSQFGSNTGVNEPVGFGFRNDAIAIYERTAFEGKAQSVQERFQPLVGMDVSWKGALRTNIQWNRARAYSLRPASEEIVEDLVNELSFTADYRKQGLDLSFLPFFGDIENQITFSLTASHTVENEREYLFRQALNEARENIGPDGAGSYEVDRIFEEGGAKVSLRTESTRLQVTPQISYRFSNRVSVDFSLRYEHFEGIKTPSYSNVDGGFNVRMSLRE